MNAFELLNENEKRIFALMLKGLTIPEVANTSRHTTDEVNNLLLQIIAKFEQSPPFKSPN